MDNTLNLIPRQDYLVIKPFVDFDGVVHGLGEVWTYQGTSFLPYDDGLTLHVLVENTPVVYRLQCRKEGQAEIIKNFQDYVNLTKL
jgi:hypothetical protein